MMMQPKKLNFNASDLDKIGTTNAEDRDQKALENGAKVAAVAEGFTSRQHSHPKIDGRSLRKTNRNFQLNISVSAATRDKFWQLASESGVASGGEFLEILLEKYVKS